MSAGLSILPIRVESDGREIVLDVQMNQGPAGPRGEWEVDRAFQLRQLQIPIDSGKLQVDFGEANTYLVVLSEDVGVVEFTNLPPVGVSTRIQLYVVQDLVGGRKLSGWPPGTMTPSGLSIGLSTAPGAVDSLVLDTFDGGATTRLNLVGRDYKLLTY